MLKIKVAIFFSYKVFKSLLNIIYSKDILLGMMSNPYIIQGTKTMNAITIGNSIVQENDISWSKRILVKEALTHIKIKI